MRRLIRVFEHGVVRVGPGGLSPQEFNRLVIYNERNANRFFAVGHRCIRFTQYVGVIQVARTTIEVLPKVGRVSEKDQGKWHGVLIEMLRRAGIIPQHSLTDAALRLRNASLFDLYIESFLRETQKLVHRGLVRKYRREESNLPVLKGRLVFREQLKRNLIHRERSYTVHQSYDRDNIYNAILKTALGIVLRTTFSPFLLDTAKSLALAFEDVATQTVTINTFRRLRFDRNTEAYRKALTIARLIILRHAPDVAHGRHDVIAILFDMNEVFERYVFAELKRAQRGVHDEMLRVTAQRSRLFWEAPGMRKTIRPDIIVEVGPRQDCRRVILDTKWKLPADGRPADADLKQMYAYNLQFGASESYLVYPDAGIAANAFGCFMPPPSRRKAVPNRCGMWFVDLFDAESHLDPTFGQRLAARLCAEF